MKKIILASSSPRRQELMKLLGLPFEIVASEFNESSINHKNPKQLVRILSLKKAESVAKKSKNALVIGSDTIVFHQGQILGKPKDRRHAKEMLKLLSGKEHVIITGYAIIDSLTGKNVSGVVSAKIKMKALEDAEIEAYIATKEPMDKAGAYAVQGVGGLFIEKINGNYFDVVGLPLLEIRKALQYFGIKILE